VSVEIFPIINSTYYERQQTYLKQTLISADFIAKKYTIKVNNNTYEVAISDALDESNQKYGN
jgi:hypothetical protein